MGKRLYFVELLVIILSLFGTHAQAAVLKAQPVTIKVKANDFPTGSGRTITITAPSTIGCSEQFEDTVATLKPGDVLILKGGTYSQTCKRSIGVQGTASAYILIMAAPGEQVIVTHGNPAANNNVELENPAYLIIRGIHFKGGSQGLRFNGGHHVVLEDNEISDTENNAIPMNSGNTDSIVIRRNHIHNTGLAPGNEGEGIYGGCNNATCKLTNSLIEGNYIHDLKSETDGGNDGIEIKVGSGGNIIRNNVIHNTNIGMRYPCIFSYGGGTNPNIIEGNVMWNCGEAMQIVSDSIVRNNIVFNSDQAITAAPHSQVSQMKNVVIANNIFVNNSSGLYVRWSSATNMVFANNLVYSSGQAFDASFGSAIISKNYVTGSGVTIDNNKFFAGGTIANAFIDVTNMDFWPKPGAPFLNQANPTYLPTNDFNNKTRTSPSDVGPYETDGAATNPGWKIQKGFKP